ncbi:ADP-ribosylation factor-like protein 15 isoform 2-T2 [Guaruba guarouba]
MDYLTMSECIQLSFAVCRIGIYTCFRALCCKGPPPPRPEYDLVCIGLTGSGKTSLLSQLCGESPENIVSTTGFSIKAVPFQNAILNVKELGGADNIRKYWSRYYQGSQGVIFVLDSASSEDDLETARNELHSALQHPQLCTLPFLILANHQDKPAARSIQEANNKGEEMKSRKEKYSPRKFFFLFGSPPHESGSSEKSIFTDWLCHLM